MEITPRQRPFTGATYCYPGRTYEKGQKLLILSRAKKLERA